MNRKPFFTILAVLLLFAACRAEEPAATTGTESPATSPEANTASAPPAQTEPAPATAPADATMGTAASPGAAPAGAPAAASLASQETNWPGITAEVTEFRRKGNTLTAKVVLRNQGGPEGEPEIRYGEVYIMDLAAGRKYEVLKDEKGTYIAYLRSGWSDRWYDKLPAGQSRTLWMKFPAPPLEVRSITLQLPGMAPFEDLPIQDA